MKWLREHTKQIMVAVVLLAMFSFVGAEGLMQVMQPDPSKEIIMNIFGRDVTQGEIRDAQVDADTLEALGFGWKFDPDMGIRHLVMLTEEARRAGIQVSEEEVAQRMSMITQSLEQRGLSLETLRQQQRITAPMIRRALERQLLVAKNVQRISDAAAPSEPQMRHYVKATQDKVQVKYVSLDAEKFVDPTEVIPDDEAQAQFEKYREVLASENEDGMGYKFPRRVQVQYAVVSLGALEPQMNVSDDEIREYWRAGRNREKYTKTVFVDEVAPGSPADTQPAEARQVPQQRVMEFSEAIPKVRLDLAKAKARKIASQAADRLVDQLSKPWTGAAPDAETGYRPIPRGVEDPAYMQNAVSEIGTRFGVTIEYGQTNLVSQQELAEHASLKGASTPGEQGAPLSLSEYAFRVPAFYKPQKGTESGLHLQLFETPNPALTVNKPGSFSIQNGQIVQVPGELEKYVVFRVVAAHDEEVPATLADVRDKVDKDLRLLHAMQRMEKQVREIYAVSRHLGLEKATPMFAELKDKGMPSTPTTVSPFARKANETNPDRRKELVEQGKLPLKPANVLAVGESERFIDACFEMTDPDWTNPEVGAATGEKLLLATTQPAVQPEPKVRMVMAPKQKKWYVVELVSSMPIDEKQYETTQRQQAFQILLSNRRFAMQQEWFKPENVESRCDFRDMNKEVTDSARGLKGPADDVG